MLLKRTYKVAGHVFSLSLEGEDRAWEALGNYDPFVIDETEELFSLEVVPEFDIHGKKELYVSEPEPGEQRIDIHTIEGGYLFEMAPLPDLPVCGWLKVSSDFSKGWLKTTSNKVFCVNNALMLMYAFRTAGLDTLEIHASCTVCQGKGFLFLGKSGTGKSTHSRLWLGSWTEYRGFTVLPGVARPPAILTMITPWERSCGLTGLRMTRFTG